MRDGKRQGAGIGVDRMTEQPDLNTGKAWFKMDPFSLRNRIEHGRSVAHIATFVMRTETEVRTKAMELVIELKQERRPSARTLFLFECAAHSIAASKFE